MEDIERSLIKEIEADLIKIVKRYEDAENDKELSKILSQCETSCEMKSPFIVEYTKEEQDLIDFLDKHLIEDTVDTNQDLVECYIRDKAIEEYKKNLKIDFFSDKSVNGKTDTFNKISVKGKIYTLNG